MISTLMNVGPVVLVCILGIIFAIAQKDKAPKAATFVMISLGVLLVLTVLRSTGAALLNQAHVGFEVMSIYYFVCNLIELATTGGLIFAAFCDREAPLPAVNPYLLQSGGVPQSSNPYVSPNAPSAPLPPLGGNFRPPQ